jgi:hypothetical protein
MTWLSPAALWLSGLAAAIIIAYFLRRLAPAYRVSALFLWSGHEERPRSFLRLLWSRVGLLLLQLAALALLVTALADPVVNLPSTGARVMAIVIDGSASMRGRLGSGTRYEQAVAQALQLLVQNPAAQTVIIQAESHSRLLASLVATRAEAVGALRASQPTFEGDADPSELLQLLRSQADLSLFEWVVFFTDHAPLSSLGDLGWEMRLLGDGQPLPNVALTGFSVRPQPDGSGFDLFVQVKNATAEPQQIPLEIKLGERSIVQQTLALEANQEADYTFNYEGSVETAGSTRFSAALSVPATDALSYDNQRFALPPQVKPLNVLWVGPANPMLEGAFRALGAATITQVDQWPGDSAAQYDLTIAYKAILPKEARGHLLLLDAAYSSIITLGDEQPAGPWQAKMNSLLTAVQPDEIVVATVRATQLAPEGQTSLMAGAWPALYVYESPDVRLVALPFNPDLDNSNLLLTVDFPILMTNIMDWLLPLRERSTELVSGDELPLQELGSDTIEVRSPSGQSCTYHNSDQSCGHVEEPGFYTITSGSIQEEFAVNPPPTESSGSETTQIAPTGQPPANVTPAGVASTPLRSAFPIWPFLLLAGLVLLALELRAFDPSLGLPWRRDERSS